MNTTNTNARIRPRRGQPHFTKLRASRSCLLTSVTPEHQNQGIAGRDQQSLDSVILSFLLSVHCMFLIFTVVRPLFSSPSGQVHSIPSIHPNSTGPVSRFLASDLIEPPPVNLTVAVRSHQPYRKLAIGKQIASERSVPRMLIRHCIGYNQPFQTAEPANTGF